MTLKEYRTLFNTSLSELYPKTEIDTFLILLIEEYLGLTRVDLVIKADSKIEDSKLLILNKALERLQKEEPIQYIIGHTEFFGHPFFVNQNTLIPRPETEELVAWIIDEVRNNSNYTNKQISILDIGTGSGCIPISLAKELNNASISAIDVSEKALEIAKKNAIENQVNINFITKDILQTIDLNMQFDIIISNPPYVRNLEKAEINNNVLENEPHLALFVEDNNALIFYDKIADLAKNHLNKNGCLFFEINQYLGKETSTLLKNKAFKNIELKQDIFKNDRMLKATL
ncbi:peptide chain release factor N(5)-glutamine methyltransferase [Polaribacter dokdonensis]|uniref:Release factor glutamine methyltransferase n=1 Tax=Polaribacter dokdonensis DSW-5 TaxID=1300348 RepID=A0A0N0CER3_9FLAO|nr:peptide chain release factor N(5)-glutamine methyltransferase [Polaribacter dokdonensis]KOY50714.1 Release factor glutamine methyltransferase [Polaribacter dokdonensis DSW-5]SEE27814.1 release factor glutamine methyltransferase [Polaribacter dokdonensis DSW-5]